MRTYRIGLTSSENDYTFVKQALATINHRVLAHYIGDVVEFEVHGTTTNEKPIFVAQAVLQALLDSRFVDYVSYADEYDEAFTFLKVGGGISPTIRSKVGEERPNG